MRTRPSAHVLPLFVLAYTSCTSPTAPPQLPTDDPLGPRDLVVDERPAPATVLPGALLQRAIDAAADGDTVLVQPATYRIEAELVIRRPLALVAPEGALLELAPGVAASVVSVAPPAGATPLAGVHLEGFAILGNGMAGSTGAGVAMINVHDSSLRRIVIDRCAEDGVYLSGVCGSRFEDLVLRRNGRHGLAFGEASTARSADNAVLGCLSRWNQLHGFDGEPVETTLFSGCEASDNGGDGFHLGAEERTHENQLVACTAAHNGRFGITIWSDANRVEDCGLRANRLAGIHIVGPAARDNVVAHCSVAGNGWNGISLDRTTRTLLHRNDVSGNALAGSGDGIAVVSSIDVFGNAIVGNRVTGDTHRFALVITRRVRGSEVRDNQFEGPIAIERPRSPGSAAPPVTGSAEAVARRP